ncbi:MAG TPA: exodeoxyribonuclease VII large subunit [Candidatus Micrarchaeia archaeon]|nr:exodeoxyribonuclease VII large subunit [Candidatus Micrarchaeia archaeon]
MAVLQVGELTARLRSTVEEEPALQDVYVEAEIGDCTRSAAGHWYLTLRDARAGQGARAAVAAVCFRGSAAGLRFEPARGQRVIAHGQVTLYAARGQLQLVVDRLEPAGVGALAVAFAQLVARLTAEGLIGEGRRRPLPFLPRRVAVVTSPTGAAIRDVLHVLHRRCPITEVLVVPTLVQGDLAPAQLVRALELAAQPSVEVVLLVRGGGSLEDLQAFNSEAVARAVTRVPVPVVVGVGHETDTTVCDLVADRRAPTPSVAAELVVPDRWALREEVRVRRARWQRSGLARVERRRLTLAGRGRRLVGLSPRRRLAGRRQDLDRAAGGLSRAMARRLAARRQRWEAARGALRQAGPGRRLGDERGRVRARRDRLRRELGQTVRAARARLAAGAGRLEALSPLAVLARGYSVTFDGARGGVVRSAAELRPGATIRTRLRAGMVDSTVTRVEEGQEGTHG